jgi:putative transcriptional regulator
VGDWPVRCSLPVASGAEKVENYGMRWKSPSALSCAIAVFGLPLTVAAQSQRVADLAVGKLLVSPRNSPDPIFAETVVLLAQMDENGAMGLMINRRGKMPLSSVLDQVKGASSRSDPVYLGGPVELDIVLALLRSATAPGKAPVVTPGIYLVATRSLLEKTLASNVGSRDFHVYMGYCGWGAGQLQNEVKRGGWYIFSGDVNLVFDAEPATLWPRLIERATMKYARTVPPAGATIGNASVSATR